MDLTSNQLIDAYKGKKGNHKLEIKTQSFHGPKLMIMREKKKVAYTNSLIEKIIEIFDTLKNQMGYNWWYDYDIVLTTRDKQNWFPRDVMTGLVWFKEEKEGLPSSCGNILGTI